MERRAQKKKKSLSGSGGRGRLRKTVLFNSAAMGPLWKGNAGLGKQPECSRGKAVSEDKGRGRTIRST